MAAAATLANAGPAKRGFVPMQGRGALAWARPPEPSHPEVLRLLVHGVADATNIAYLKEVEVFLHRAQRERLDLRGSAALDWALARELDRLCYSEGTHIGRGQKLIHGFLHIFPEFRGERLPLALRALRAWERFGTTNEGGPLARETCYLLAERMIADGEVEACVVTLLALDGYLREQDWEQLRGEDIVVSSPEKSHELPGVALLLGRKHRGERSKTGQEQGVKLEDEFVVRVLAALAALVPPDSRVFITADAFRRIWRSTLEKLDMGWVGPPHSLRHSGPSADASTGRRTLEDIRRRGRWSQIKSVQRYAKPHALTVHLARLPAGAKVRGRHLMDNFAYVFARHMPKKHPWSAGLAAALRPMLRRGEAR